MRRLDTLGELTAVLAAEKDTKQHTFGESSGGEIK